MTGPNWIDTIILYYALRNRMLFIVFVQNRRRFVIINIITSAYAFNILKHNLYYGNR